MKLGDKYHSFGRYPESDPKDVKKVFWTSELPDLGAIEGTVLPFGLGKSYGDSCLNNGGTLIDMRSTDRFIAFDRENGTLTTEAGVTLAECLNFLVPRGFFLQSTPGTKHITVGGAIANDVHGKNHHKSGTFGSNTVRFELVRSNGERMICSESENPEMFRATIGGLGLTGIITKAEFKVRPVKSPFMYIENIRYDSLSEFFDINRDSDKDFEYTVSWIDCTASGSTLGRGIFNRGNHADPALHDLPKFKEGNPIPFPFDAPFINNLSVETFNRLYYHKQFDRTQKTVAHYNPFFYPLDAVNNWQNAYGKRGFLQYQFVLPFGDEEAILKEMLKIIGRSGMSSFLVVLKTFGNIKSPGMLSFPRPGVTLALDFRMTGEPVLKLLDRLDLMVLAGGGAYYPAKDARMSPKVFHASYPNFNEFAQYIDPKFSSNFIRRVTEQGK